jgi:hypothetical protein
MERSSLTGLLLDFNRVTCGSIAVWDVFCASLTESTAASYMRRGLLVL